MMISDLLSSASVLFPLKSTGREGILRELVAAAQFDRSFLPEETAFRAVLERETAFSTAIGEATAVPHAKCALREEMVMVLGVSPGGVDFSAADGNPVRFFFLVLTRKDVSGLHLKTLARIARLIKIPGFAQEILSSSLPTEAIEVLRKAEITVS